MTDFIIGDIATLDYVLTVDGVAAAATVVLTVTAPGGTVTTPVVSNPTLGTYRADVPLNQGGTWRYRWTATGAATDAEEGDFHVRVGGSVVIDLEDARAQLNKAGARTYPDAAELQGFIDAAVEVVEDRCGPVLPVAVVEVHDGGDHDVMLRRFPVLSVSEVKEYRGVSGTVLPLSSLGAPADGYELELETGRLTRVTASGYDTAFAWGTRNVRVTYQAGRSSVPRSIRLAALIIVEQLWRSSQNRAGGRPQVGQPETTPPTATWASTYSIPNRAVELLRPYLRTGGIG